MDTNKINDFKNIINRRNMRETIACLIVFPLFIYMGLKKEELLDRILCFEISLSALFIISWVYFKSFRYIRLPIGSSSEMQELVHREIKLLLTVRYWYVLPFGIGLVGLNLNDLYISYISKQSILNDIIALAVTLFLAIFIIYLNEKKGVKSLKFFLT